MLNRITRKSRQNINLLKTIQSLLPATLADECYSISSSDHRLIIYTSSPAWSSKLRFQLPSIQQTLASKHGLDISDISVRTLSDTPGPALDVKEIKRCQLSEKSAQNISTTAASIVDPSLKDALLKLAASSKCTASEKGSK